MVIVLTVSALVIGVSAAFIWFLTAGAPEGYENESGFHYSPKSVVAKKPAVKSVPATIEAHNDHEPIAA
jgi:hypothetical protein